MHFNNNIEGVGKFYRCFEKVDAVIFVFSSYSSSSCYADRITRMNYSDRITRISYSGIIDISKFKYRDLYGYILHKVHSFISINLYLEAPFIHILHV